MKRREEKPSTGPMAGYAPLQILAINATKDELNALGKNVKEEPVFGLIQRYVPLAKLTGVPGVLEIRKNKNRELDTKQLAGMYKTVFKKDFDLSQHTVTEDLQAEAVKVILTVKQAGKIFDVVFEWFADVNIPYGGFHLLNEHRMTKQCFAAECNATAYKQFNKKSKKYEFTEEGREAFTLHCPAPTRYKEAAQGAVGTFLDLVKWFKTMLAKFEDDETGLSYRAKEFDFYNEIGGDDLVYKGDTSALNRLLALYTEVMPAAERGIYALAGVQFSDRGIFTKVFPGFAEPLAFDSKTGAIKEILVDQKHAVTAAKYLIYVPTPIKARRELTVDELRNLQQIHESQNTGASAPKGGNSSAVSGGGSSDPFGASSPAAF